MKRREVLEVIGIGVTGLAFVSCSNDDSSRQIIKSSNNSNGAEASKTVSNEASKPNATAGDSDGTSSNPVSVDKMLALTVFSKEVPGKWAGKEATHAPILTVADNKLTISTPHGMSREHYIMWHQVRDRSGSIIFEVEFTQPPVPPASGTIPSATPPGPAPILPPTIVDLAPLKLAPGSELRVYSLCNQHGIWVAAAVLA